MGSSKKADFATSSSGSHVIKPNVVSNKKGSFGKVDSDPRNTKAVIDRSFAQPSPDAKQVEPLDESKITINPGVSNETRHYWFTSNRQKDII